MYQEKQYKITTILGLILFLAGCLSSRFITLKPNRIIEGTVMDMYTVMKDSSVLITVFFLLMILSLVLVFRRSSNWYMLTFTSISLIFIIFYSIGQFAQVEMLNYSSAARIALSIGFWLTFIGLLIIMDASLHFDMTYGSTRLLLVFTCLFIGMLALIYLGSFDHIGLMKEFRMRQDAFTQALKSHLTLTLIASLVGLIISICMSYLGYKHKRFKKHFLFISNGAQVIPTLSFLGLLMIPLTILAKEFTFLKAIGISGIGFFPAFIVLTSYTLLPIVNQALSGFETIDRHIIISAQAMGMTKGQLFLKVELPLALPAILSGFKIALIQSTANAILAGLVGAGGLGALLFLGLAQSAPDLVTLSALSIVFIALILNGFLSVIIDQIEKRKGFI